jgi:uncharacterized protein YggE
MRKFAAFALPLTLVLGLAVPAVAQTAAPRTLTMTGSASAKAAPDMADISAGVTSDAPTAAAALAANSASMNRLFAALDRLGVTRKNVQTSNFNVSPVYANRTPNEAQRLTGYRVNNDVHVILEDIAKVGATLDALVAAGANQMNGLNFTIKDPAPLLARARADAVADARVRAQQYAAAAGVALGPIQSLSEGGGEAPRPMYRVMAMAAAPTPIAAGEESVNASVTIVWEIR